MMKNVFKQFSFVRSNIGAKPIQSFNSNKFFYSTSPSSSHKHIIVDKRDNGIALIRLNRPKALNALCAELCKELGETIQDIEKDTNVRVTVITGSEKAFAAGADIKEMKDLSFMDVYKTNLFGDLDAIPRAKKPIIAAVNGYALGGGCELAMMCDFIVAGDKAKFGQPEIKLGTIPGVGGTQRLTKTIGKQKAMEWVLTGGMYNASEAEKAGLVSRVVESEKLEEEVLKIAETIASYSSPITQLAKECVNKSIELSVTEGLAYEKRVFQSTFGTKDQKEGMAAFSEKRKPSFKDE